MIDFSTLKELYADGKKVTSLFLDGHEVPIGEPEVNWIRFTTLERTQGGRPFTVALSGSSSAKMDLLSSYDGKNWGEYNNNTQISSQGVDPGQTIYFKAASKNERASASDQTQWHFVTGNAAFKLDGDLKYLLDPTGEETSCMQYGFRGLFESNFQVHDISGLSITLPNLGVDSCKRLFANCSYLSAGNMYIEPQLPVNNRLPTGIFSEMFAGSGVTSAPELFSLSSSRYMYNSMFFNCGSLSTGPYIHSKYFVSRGNNFTTMFANSYSLSSVSVDFTSWSDTTNWLATVKNTIDGIFTCPSALGTDETIARGSSNCPTNWRVANYDVNGYDMQNAFIRGIQTTAFLEDGSSHVPDMAALSVFNGQTAERLYDMTQYTVQLPADTTTVGTKTIQFNGTGVYFGAKEIYYKIIAKNLSSCTATVSSVYDNDEVTYIEVVQPDTGYTLVEGTDYTVAVSTSGDQSTVTITGIGSWTGTKTVVVAHKTSGTTPVTFYKADPNAQGTFAVGWVKNNSSAPAISMQVKVDNGSWQTMDTGGNFNYEGIQDCIQVRALNMNEKIGNSDDAYNYLMVATSSDVDVAVSGSVKSLLDRSEQITALTADYCLAGTMSKNSKIIDASKLSCGPLLLTGSRAMTRFLADSSVWNDTSKPHSRLSAAPNLEGLSVGSRNSYIFIETCWKVSSLTSVYYPLPWATGATNDGYYIGGNNFGSNPSLVRAVVRSHFGDGVPCASACRQAFNETFSHCTSLSCISTDLTAWATNGFQNWVNGVAATGTFICPEALGTDATIQRGNNYCPTGWTVVNPDAKPVPVKFTAEQSNSTVALSAKGTAPSVSLLKSTDGETWTSYTVNDTVTLANVGDYVMFKADQPNSGFASSNADYNQFVMTGQISAEGNIMSLLDGADKTYTISSDRCFQNLFANCSQLTQAPELPATELCSNCYTNMFAGCTSLSVAPELPATTLADNCYRSMFSGCTSLSAAPALPATTLASYCYYYMFSGCTSLSSAPELPATTLAEHCYQGMLGGCTALSVAPALPATTLAEHCYAFMFYGSSSLSSMDVKFTAWSPSTATNSWLFGVAAAGTFKCPADLDTTLSDDSHIPSGWTVKQPMVGEFWRLTVKECYRKDAQGNPATGYDINYSQFGAFYLYDENGNVVNQGLTEVDTGYTPSLLQNGQCCKGSEMTYGSSSESMEKMFDSSTDSKCATSSPSPTDSSLNDSTKWLVYCFRLPANANTPVSYNFYSGNDGNPERNAISWVLESSTDGIDWIVVDEETQYTTGIPSGSSGWYNGGEAFVFDEEPPTPTPTFDDTDGDGYSDAEETAAGSDPDNPDSTPDDRDGDGYSNDDEESAGTDPDDPGSYPGSDDEPDPDDPSDIDTDGDGWSDSYEEAAGSDPNDSGDIPADSDGDGFTDYDEQEAGTDPNDPGDNPGVEPDPEEEPEEEP